MSKATVLRAVLLVDNTALLCAYRCCAAPRLGSKNPGLSSAGPQVAILRDSPKNLIIAFRERPRSLMHFTVLRAAVVISYCVTQGNTADFHSLRRE